MGDLFCYQGYCINSTHVWIAAFLIIGPFKYYYNQFFSKKPTLPAIKTPKTALPSLSEPVIKVVPKTQFKSRPLPLPPKTGNIYHINNPKHLRKIQDLGLQQDKHIVVYFTASYCGPCNRMYPFYEAMSEVYDAIFTVTDVSDYKEFRVEHDVTYIPAYMVLKFEDNEWTRLDIGAGADTTALNKMVLEFVPKLASEEGIVEDSVSDYSFVY